MTWATFVVEMMCVVLTVFTACEVERITDVEVASAVCVRVVGMVVSTTDVEFSTRQLVLGTVVKRVVVTLDTLVTGTVL